MTSFCCDHFFCLEASTPIQSRSEVLGVRTSTYESGGHDSAHDVYCVSGAMLALGVQGRPDLITALTASVSATR